jgi:hypothetical protein
VASSERWANAVEAVLELDGLPGSGEADRPHRSASDPEVLRHSGLPPPVGLHAAGGGAEEGSSVRDTRSAEAATLPDAASAELAKAKSDLTAERQRIAVLEDELAIADARITTANQSLDHWQDRFLPKAKHQVAFEVRQAKANWIDAGYQRGHSRLRGTTAPAEAAMGCTTPDQSR